MRREERCEGAGVGAAARRSCVAQKASHPHALREDLEQEHAPHQQLAGRHHGRGDGAAAARGAARSAEKIQIFFFSPFPNNRHEASRTAARRGEARRHAPAVLRGGLRRIPAVAAASAQRLLRRAVAAADERRGGEEDAGEGGCAQRVRNAHACPLRAPRAADAEQQRRQLAEADANDEVEEVALAQHAQHRVRAEERRLRRRHRHGAAAHGAARHGRRRGGPHCGRGANCSLFCSLFCSQIPTRSSARRPHTGLVKHWLTSASQTARQKIEETQESRSGNLLKGGDETIPGENFIVVRTNPPPAPRTVRLFHQYWLNSDGCCVVSGDPVVQHFSLSDSHSIRLRLPNVSGKRVVNF